MRTRHHFVSLVSFLVVGAAGALVFGACGSSSSDTPADAGGGDVGARGSEHVGQSCTTPANCYVGLEGGSVKGDIQCLNRVSGGYCTHLCTTDADCCAVPGECVTGFKQLCAPFESTGQMMCFLSCESGDLHAIPPDGGTDAAGQPLPDPNVYCQYYVGTDFQCRSTGGGKANKQVCVPGGTASDAGPG